MMRVSRTTKRIFVQASLLVIAVVVVYLLAGCNNGYKHDDREMHHDERELNRDTHDVHEMEKVF